MQKSRFTESQIVKSCDYNERRPMTHPVGHPVPNLLGVVTPESPQIRGPLDAVVAQSARG